MKPIQIYMAPKAGGPNPWKVVMVLSELGVEYEIAWTSFQHIKEEPYISLNPNGRVPAMIDPNKNVTLFESGAIIEYIIDVYDTEHRLSYSADSLQEKWHAYSWLMFQMSGQGPTFGQRMWFVHFHWEKDVRSAIDRFGDESKRILKVLDDHLRKRAAESGDPEGATWLVGDKCTFADLSFVMWNVFALTALFPTEPPRFEEEYPAFYRWHQRLVERPAVKKVLELREKTMKELEHRDTAVAAIAAQNAVSARSRAQ